MNFLTNWKTSAAGLSAILIAGGNLLAHVSAGDFSTLGTDGSIILTGLIGLLSKDANVTGGSVHQ